MTLRTQILGRLAIERYLERALDKLPAGTGSSIVHVVGGDMGGGFEWQTAPAYRTTVRRGITAIALDPEGKISRLTTLWDGAMLPLDESKHSRSCRSSSGDPPTIQHVKAVIRLSRDVLARRMPRRTNDQRRMRPARMLYPAPVKEKIKTV